MKRRTTAALCAALLVAPLPASAAAIDRISLYAGTWATHIVHYKTEYSRPRVDDMTLRNDCWRSAGYYACDQFVKGASQALIVFTYDRRHAMYRTYTVPTDGSPAGSGTLLVSGKTWTYPWTDKAGGTTVYVRVVNTFLSARAIAYRQEVSRDGERWILTASGTEHRL